jgi:hypothetical protein
MNEEICDSGNNASDLYSGDAQFEFRLGTPTLLRVFVIFLSLFRKLPGYYLNLGHDHLRPHTYHLINLFKSSNYSSLYSLSYWQRR